MLDTVRDICSLQPYFGETDKMNEEAKTCISRRKRFREESVMEELVEFRIMKAQGDREEEDSILDELCQPPIVRDREEDAIICKETIGDNRLCRLCWEACISIITGRTSAGMVPSGVEA
jgi:hypothetical protein